MNRQRHFDLLGCLIAISALLFALGCSVSVDPADSLETDPVDTSQGSDGDADADADGDADTDTVATYTPWGGEDTAWDWPWDTGTGRPTCDSWMTVEECTAVSGIIWDIDLFLTECIDGKKKRCCLEGTMEGTPCSGAGLECAGAASCQERGGAITVDYQCANWKLKCCQGATPISTDTDDYWEPQGFDPAVCPFNQADTDSDTTYDIVYRPTVAEQPDSLISGLCMELPLFDETVTPLDQQPFFCPQHLYDRIESDVAQIRAMHPVVDADVGGQIFNSFGTQKVPFTMLCTASTTIPETCVKFEQDGFDELMQCYGGDYVQCLFDDDAGDCGMAFTRYHVAANTPKMIDAFEAQANHLVPGSICELDAYFSIPSADGLNGIHISNVDPGSGVWMWKARSTAYFNLGVSACDVTIDLYSAPVDTDSDTSTPSTATQVYDLSATLEPKPECTDPLWTAYDTP